MTKEQIEEKKPVMLNLGCGADIAEGFINIDVRNIPGIDMRIDIRKLPFENDSADHIRLHDVLEHFPLRIAVDVLKECFRVLKTDMELAIKVPDLIGLAEKIKRDEITAFDFQEYVYGGQNYQENFHYSGYTSQFLTGILFGIGFKRIDTIQKIDTNIVVTGIK